MKDPIIATLGGHSALEICLGAKRQGLGTLVILQKGRDKIYSRHFSSIVDEYILVEKFCELTSENTIAKLKDKNTIFIPHRYVQVYCDLEKIENNFPIPVFGNKYLLKYEERSGIFNQYQLLYESGVDYPVQFKDPKDIDRLVIVKAKEKERNYERAFFFATNYKQFQSESARLVREGRIDEKDLSEAVIEEFLTGAQVNFNFYYSPISEKLELLGTDIRRQTNIDGLIRLPSVMQNEILKLLDPSYIEVGHIAVTVKESLLEKAFILAERILDGVKTFVPPGIIGPFALQTAILAGPPKEKIVVYDLSLRMPGSPGAIFTPYSQYHFNRPVSFGERIAMEVNEAKKLDKLSKITT